LGDIFRASAAVTIVLEMLLFGLLPLCVWRFSTDDHLTKYLQALLPIEPAKIREVEQLIDWYQRSVGQAC
jgi:hypothetical protein